MSQLSASEPTHSLSLSLCSLSKQFWDICKDSFPMNKKYFSPISQKIPHSMFTRKTLFDFSIYTSITVVFIFTLFCFITQTYSHKLLFFKFERFKIFLSNPFLHFSRLARNLIKDCYRRLMDWFVFNHLQKRKNIRPS